MAKMKSLVFFGDRELSLEEVERPTIQKNTDAVIKTVLTTICGSDLHIYHGELPVEPPFPIGHEFVGVVEEVGKGVRKFKEGDRVAVSCVVHCGHCYYCLRGLYGHCEQGGIYGCGSLLGNLGGAQAEYVRVPFADLGMYKIPDGMREDEVLYVGDILATGFTGAVNGRIQPGDIVAVFGSGPVGLCAQVCAQLFSPAVVMAVDILDYRLEISRSLGCVTVNPGREDTLAKIGELSQGRGADVAIEAVGVSPTMEGCLNVVRPGGRVSSVGIFSQPMEFPLPVLCMKDVSLVMSIVDVQWMPNLIRLIREKKLDLTFLNSHTMSLAEGVKAYEIFDRKEDQVLKILMKP